MSLGKGDDSSNVVESLDKVVISYKGSIEGRVFETNSSFSYQVDGGEVIRGMSQGVLGMREGGVRCVIIPPSLGYGKRGSGPDVPPNSTLTFDVTLLKIVKA